MNYLIYSCFLFLIIVAFAYINSLQSIENFTPEIRKLYRPHVRKIRVYSEGFYNKTTTNISNLFRKFGIM
jgi:hypothetical protein